MSSHIEKIWIPTGGGLGDIVRCYLKDEPFWGYLKNLKEVRPRTKIKVISTSHNPETPALFKYTPFIDEVQEMGWMLDGSAIQKQQSIGYTSIHDAMGHLRTLKHTPPDFYLGPEDEDQYNSIVSSGRYVFVHPFAMRAAMPLEEFAYMTDRLIDQYKMHVVIVGANHVRVARKGATGPNDPGGRLSMKEEFNYERPGLFNLTNRSNVRVAMKLCSRATRFLGHCSCYNIVAWIKGIKSFVFSPPSQRHFLATTRSHAWPLIDNLPWCKNVFSDEWASPRSAADQALEFLGQ
jgi:hypothetical protein